MENTELRRQLGMVLVNEVFASLSRKFLAEEFFNAVETKRYLGSLIKHRVIDGYRDLQYNNYKAVFDVLRCKDYYHMGIDFGQQAIHITLGPGDVYSLYFRGTEC